MITIYNIYIQNSSTNQLSVVVLDVDRTLIRSVRNTSSTNPYPYYKSQHVEEYFHFTLNTESKRSNSVTRSYNNSVLSSPPSSPHTLPSNVNSNHKRIKSKELIEHYHIYVRPGLKKLMTYLNYLQETTNVKMVIASMAKRDYVNSILKGLQKHCGERKYPKFDAVLTRESWDENLSPSSTPTYPISVLLQQYAKHGLTKKINLKFKSIKKIAEILNIDNNPISIRNILVVDDDMGYYDHDDRVSGQIYQIPPWNGPISYKNTNIINQRGRENQRGRRGKHDITIYHQSDNELPSLGAMIQAIVDKGSIKEYLFTRVLSVFRHEYGSKHKKQIKC